MNLLLITTIAGTQRFFTPLMRALTEAGHTVDLACSETEKLSPSLDGLYRKAFEISCSRSPLRLDNIRAIRQLRRIVDEEQYDIVHCHTPVAAMCTRIACKGRRRSGLKVVYTAHGFHFYHGAPLKNWLLFYPVEWICSFWTDLLITITSEDYQRAQKRLHARRTEYVPGVGIDIGRFSHPLADIGEKRRSIGIPEDCTMLLSVGELNDNKNHQLILSVLSDLQRPDVYYVIAGAGARSEALIEQARALGLSSQLRLLGCRDDVAELYHAADLYLLPSKREGLNVSVMEAMASGLPVVCHRIRGNTDLVSEGKGGLLCPLNDTDAWTAAVSALIESKEKRAAMGNYNRDEAVLQYAQENIIARMTGLYSGLTAE